MKKILILSLSLIIVFSISVFAYDNKQLIAESVPFKIFVNQEEKVLKNDIVLIENTTYLPLREMSEILGMDVEWSEESKSITIKEPQNEFERGKEDIENSMLYPFESNGLWGYMDERGKIVIEAEFEYAFEFSEDLAIIKDKNEKYGYIDLTGEIVIPCKYFLACNFSEGFAVVQEREYSMEEDPIITDTIGPYFYIDKSGKNIFKNEYLYANDFSEGYAEVLTNDAEVTYINKSGEVATTLNFKSASKFKDGHATVNLKEKGYAVIDKNFKITYLCEYNSIYGTKEGYVIASNKKKYGVLNTKGDVLIDFQYEYLSECGDGLFIYRKDMKSGQGYIDINNEAVIPNGKFKTLFEFENGFAIVSAIGEGQNYGLINKNAEYVIQPQYKWINTIGDGMYLCLTHSGEYKYFNAYGDEIIPY